MQLQETVWDELSASSKEALRWSAAVARLRADRAGMPIDRVEADEFDLLVGVMLSHPRESEARQLLGHIGASAADILPPDYPVPSEDLERYAAELPDGLPELTDMADGAVELAAELPRSSEVIELRALFGGLLLGSNRVAATFSDLLAPIGLGAVKESYRDYLAGKSAGGYAAFLGEMHPFRPEPVEIPDYKADRATVGEDLVDIHAEVDAFAYLLASRSLRPPLAVGLFGDWGSGKTYFMKSVQERIARLVESPEAIGSPQRDLPFWKQIVQIDFNAWHYVGGDLWASLVEHVFSELRVTREESETELTRRQRHWIQQIEAKRHERSDVRDQIADKKREKEAAQHDLEVAEEDKRREEKRLEDARQQAVEDVILRSSLNEATEALAAAADRQTSGKASETLVAIEEVRTQLQRGSVALGAYPWSRRKTVFALVALLAVPALVLVLDQIDAIPTTAQVFAGVTAALGILTAALRTVTSWTKGRLDQLESAEAAVRADIEEQRKAVRAKVDEAAENVAKVDARIDELTSQDRSLGTEIAALELRARSLTSRQILGDFVAERVGSSDYRKLLGTTALIQRDFDELSRLIEEQNEEFLATDTGEKPPEAETLNRIILYVDDLDRCEPKRVIDVLQAVHLLLAFPLFVVVVAVDSRWLANSLAEHYPALALPVDGDVASSADADQAEQATPSDYLEKIFQVPFWVEPLDSTSRKTLVRGLLQGNLARTAGREEGPVGMEELDFSTDAAAMVQTLFDRAPRMRLQTAAMSVTPDELTYLDELAPLLGNTPRSIKRFVNVYQLLCALPVPPDVGSPLYEEAVAFLLALTDGLPKLSVALHRELETAEPTGTLKDVIARVRPKLPAEEMTRFDEWVGAHAHVAGVSAARLAEPARRVRRFSFR